MMLLISIICLVIPILIKYIWDFYSFWKFFQKLPGEKTFHPLFGNMHLLPGPNEEGLKYEFQLVTRFKFFNRVWAGPFTPVLVCYHPSVAKTILKSTAPKPRGLYISTPYDMGFRWLGDGLLIANGNKWSRNRRLLTPAFHFDILKPYVDVFNNCAKLLVQKFHSLEGQSFDVFQPISHCTLDVILRTAFSYNSDCQTSSEQSQYVKNIQELIQLWTVRTYAPQLYNEFIYGLTSPGKRFYSLCDDVHKFAEELIEKRRSALKASQTDGKENTSKVKDFLDTLLLAKDENGNGLSSLEIRNEVDTFLFEGNDTTTSGVSWSLYSLAAHPEYQNRVYKEVMEVLDGRDQMEWADLSKLEYTTMCIKEAMRCHTVVPFIERRLNEPLDFDGHIIPEGTLTAIHIWDLHHNPHVWDQPHVYDPERFCQENQSKMDPFQFIPFSAGSRNCIGQNFAMNEMRILVSSIVKNFKLEADEELPRKFYAVTIKTENGAKISAIPRS